MQITRFFAHELALGLIVAERGDGEELGDEVDGQNLHDRQGERDVKQDNCSKAYQISEQLGHVTREAAEGAFLDVTKDGAAFLDSTHERVEAVVEQDDVA